MEKRTLLQKYQIPISHLDFDYVKNCKNIKELEKIVTILRSGEEGHYPDLTKCAEEKLRELKPQSRFLRTEERILTKQSVSSEDWRELSAPIAEWSNEIKNKDSILSKTQENSGNDNEDVQLPPIRKGGKVATKKLKEIDGKNNSTPAVAGTNYSQWDKYDADAEILKMDLEEERSKEQVERMNRINQQKSENLEMERQSKSNICDKLLPVEREKLAEDYKIRGNDYFRAKEYSNALEQYSRCLEIQASAAGFNNRAITNLKLKRYEDSLSDCTECLKLDELNVKAWLRKAESYLGLELKHDALRTYEHIEELDPTNPVALRAIASLKKELGDVAPLHATRLQITECTDSNEEILEKSKSLEKSHKPKARPPKPPKKVDYDLAELVKPNKLVKNSLMKTMENLGRNLPAKKAGSTEPLSERSKKLQLQEASPEFNLKIRDSHHKTGNQYGKLLIEEL